LVTRTFRLIQMFHPTPLQHSSVLKLLIPQYAELCPLKVPRRNWVNWGNELQLSSVWQSCAEHKQPLKDPKLPAFGESQLSLFHFAEFSLIYSPFSAIIDTYLNSNHSIHYLTVGTMYEHAQCKYNAIAVAHQI